MEKAIILGIIQGVTEFLPVSSTAHLVVFPMMIGWTSTLLNSLAFDVALHAGTLVSVLICFASDLRDMLGKKRRFIWLIIIASVPAAVIGILFEDYVESTLRSPMVIAISLVVFGLVMYGAERFKGNGKGKVESMSRMDALLIGFAQAIALIPGVSRSGITISAGMMRGVSREQAARFSFLMSIPVIGGAMLLQGRKLFGGDIDVDMAIVGAGFIASLITGVIVIKAFLAFLRKFPLHVFIVYRFLFAGAIVGWLWLGQ
jgi:undecaprenyl-diphosphatase